MKGGLGNPADYREIFDLLESGGVLEPEVTRKVRGIAGYRNRLVHDYARIDEKEMWATDPSFGTGDWQNEVLKTFRELQGRACEGDPCLP